LDSIQRSEFVCWVNQVLKLHDEPLVEEFKVCVDLSFSYAKDIDNWIKLARKKRVKNLSPQFKLDGIRVRLQRAL
jgi:hypothetical protein